MAKKFAVIFGIAFVFFGLLGFVPNPIVGADGFFLTDAIHNVVHLLVGVVLLVAAKSASASSMWLKIFGVVYLLLFVNGLIQPEKLLGFVTANTNDIWLHLGLTIALLLAGFVSGKSSMAMDKSTV